jgi:hypothetical protein
MPIYGNFECMNYREDAVGMFACWHGLDRTAQITVTFSHYFTVTGLKLRVLQLVLRHSPTRGKNLQWTELCDYVCVTLTLLLAETFCVWILYNSQLK